MDTNCFIYTYIYRQKIYYITGYTVIYMCSFSGAPADRHGSRRKFGAQMNRDALFPRLRDQLFSDLFQDIHAALQRARVAVRKDWQKKTATFKAAFDGVLCCTVLNSSQVWWKLPRRFKSMNLLNYSGIGQEEVRWLQDAEESFDMSVFFPHEEAEAELAYFIETLSTSRMCRAKAI